MPQPSQLIRKDVMARVRICLEYQKALKVPVRMTDILNEIVSLGLEVYARQYGVSLPPRSETGPGAQEEGTMPVNGRRRKTQTDAKESEKR